MIQPRMTSSPAKKLASDSELVTSFRLLVRMITTGGRVNWKTPKMELQVSFLLLNFRNGMFLLFYDETMSSLPVLNFISCIIKLPWWIFCFNHYTKRNCPRLEIKSKKISCPKILNPHLIVRYLFQLDLHMYKERRVWRQAEWLASTPTNCSHLLRMAFSSRYTFLLFLCILSWPSYNTKGENLQIPWLSVTQGI